MSFAGRGGDDLYTELWKLCAGPLVDVPKHGEKFYFPQGHMEQVQCTMLFGFTVFVFVVSRNKSNSAFSFFWLRVVFVPFCFFGFCSWKHQQIKGSISKSLGLIFLPRSFVVLFTFDYWYSVSDFGFLYLFLFSDFFVSL